MKKYLIHFMSIDAPSVEDDGIGDGSNFGIYEKTFNTREEAEKGLEELIEQDKADLEECYGLNEEECYGLNEEDCDSNIEIEIENGRYDRKELIAYDGCDELNTTIYEIVEVNF